MLKPKFFFFLFFPKKKKATHVARDCEDGCVYIYITGWHVIDIKLRDKKGTFNFIGEHM